MKFLFSWFKSGLTFALMLLGSYSMRCQVVFNFNTSPYISPSSNVANITVSDIVLSAGMVQPNITTGSYFIDEPYIQGNSGWAQTSQPSAKRFCVTLTPASGYSFSINSVAYDAYATGTGPAVTGYSIGSTYYAGSNLPEGGTVITSISNMIIDQNNITTARDVCIQGWANGSRTTNGSGDFRIDNFIIGISTVLPVSIFKYQLVLEKKGIVSWSTLSETNNSHFTIDHSTDGSQWSEIGRVEASLDRNNEKDYAFEHDSPAQGINYYRLNQFDLDGTKTTFDVLVGFMNTSKEDYLFPTITHDKIYLSSGKEGLVKIFDAMGKMVLVQNYHSGNAINVDNISKGQYFLKHSESTHPFIKE